MISTCTNNFQLKYPQSQRKELPSFAGDKDILLINDNPGSMRIDYSFLQYALADKFDEYTIHTAMGGKKGLEKAEKYKPIFTVTAYHMPEGLKPHGEELIKALKKLGTKVIVLSSAWGAEDIDKAVSKCENICGADKFIFPVYYDLFKETVMAIINGKPIPKHSYQQKTNKTKKGNN